MLTYNYISGLNLQRGSIYKVCFNYQKEGNQMEIPEAEKNLYIEEICSGAKTASKRVSTMTTVEKNRILNLLARKLR